MKVIEFLHRVIEIMGDYFGGNVDEGAIKESFSLVYQLLEEMMDNGHPLTTEPNALKAMIQPPTTFVRLVNATTGKVSLFGQRKGLCQWGSSECSRVPLPHPLGFEFAGTGQLIGVFVSIVYRFVYTKMRSRIRKVKTALSHL